MTEVQKLLEKAQQVLQVGSPETAKAELEGLIATGDQLSDSDRAKAAKALAAAGRADLELSQLCRTVDSNAAYPAWLPATTWNTSEFVQFFRLRFRTPCTLHPGGAHLSRVQ